MKKRNLQTHGRNSKVYVPILLSIFREKFAPGMDKIDFSLDDVRRAAEQLGLSARNAADVIYRMRSRTVLPKEILDEGFYVLRQVGRGRYRLEKATSTIIELPEGPITDALDTTPLPVRRLLPEDLAEIDEQGLLTMIGYCNLLSHFTGLTVYRLRSHVRRSVTGVGQAELDEVDVGIAMREDEMPVIFPIEAKAADDAINRVQIATGVLYAKEYFPGYEIRPLAIKIDYEGILHFVEFNPTDVAAELKIIHHARYRLTLSEKQLELIRKTQQGLRAQTSYSPSRSGKKRTDGPTTGRAPTAIDLFCGCGGLSTGLLDAGVQVLGGFDWDAPSIEAYNYNHNHRGATGTQADLHEASGEELLKRVGVEHLDLLVGGPPCQPFSVVGQRRGLGDLRGLLLFQFVRLVDEIRPTAFILENVPNVQRVQGGKTFEALLDSLHESGYALSWKVLHAADYGVAQMRQRMFIVGVQGDTPVPMPPPPTHTAAPQQELLQSALLSHLTCRDVLDDLPDVSNPASRLVPNHEPTLHSPAMLQAFACLQPGTRDRKSHHDRLHPERLSYTLRAGNGNFSPLRPVHYRYDRVLTVRESARIQGFSDSFIWPDSLPRLQQYRQVGNAVPPALARNLAAHVSSFLGWKLEPDRFRGDPAVRPPSETKTFEERLAERMSRIRGASLGEEAKRTGTD